MNKKPPTVAALNLVGTEGADSLAASPKFHL